MYFIIHFSCAQPLCFYISLVQSIQSYQIYNQIAANLNCGQFKRSTFYTKYWWLAFDVMAAMLEVQHKGICPLFHCRIQLAWVVDIVSNIPRDWLQTKYTIFQKSLIIHKEIKQSHQRIGSRAYTFKTGKYSVSLISILYIKMIILTSILYIKNTN